MPDWHAQLEQAIERHRQGDLAEAENLYRRILEAQPEQWETMYLLATALLQSGRFEECIGLFERTAAAQSDVADVHNNLGVAYKAAGRWNEAERSFRAALEVNPQYGQALFNLAVLLEARGRPAEAEAFYRRAAEADPNDAQSRTCLGNVLKAQEKWAEAEACYCRVAESEPQNLDVRVNLAFVLTKQEKLDDAARVYREILDVRPDYPEVHNSLSFVYERQGRLDEAVDSARRSLELNPDFPEGHNNLGNALRSLHRLDEACASFEKAIELRPGFALAEFNCGTTKLLQGNYTAGWPGYRRHTDLVESPATFSEPEWNGTPIPGKKLLVHADQGFGDAIQFARFLPEAKPRSRAEVVFVCSPELKRLFAGLPGVDVLLAENEERPACDARVALSDLAAVLEVTLDTLPADVPYIDVDPHASVPEDMEERLAQAPESNLRVGLSWRGNPAQARDVLRSLPLETLVPLADVDGVSWFSLQTGDIGPREIEELKTRFPVIDLGACLRDFADTAAVIERLDLVVSVDTAVAHLAGALGKPVWTLLAHTPDWRWHLERTDSPWYPTMRLFRQPEWGAWDTVVRDVAAELERRKAAKEQRV